MKKTITITKVWAHKDKPKKLAVAKVLTSVIYITLELFSLLYLSDLFFMIASVLMTSR